MVNIIGTLIIQRAPGKPFLLSITSQNRAAPDARAGWDQHPENLGPPDRIPLAPRDGLRERCHISTSNPISWRAMGSSPCPAPAKSSLGGRKASFPQNSVCRHHPHPPHHNSSQSSTTRVPLDFTKKPQPNPKSDNILTLSKRSYLLLLQVTPTITLIERQMFLLYLISELAGSQGSAAAPPALHGWEGGGVFPFLAFISLFFSSEEKMLLFRPQKVPRGGRWRPGEMLLPASPRQRGFPSHLSYKKQPIGVIFCPLYPTNHPGIPFPGGPFRSWRVSGHPWGWAHREAAWGTVERVFIANTPPN